MTAELRARDEESHPKADSEATALRMRQSENEAKERKMKNVLLARKLLQAGV